jgi:hypothetical protein
MSAESWSYYTLKGIASGSVVIAAGLIGFFSNQLVDGTDPGPLLLILGLALMVSLTRGAEAKLDDSAARDDLDQEDEILAFIFLVAVMWLFIGLGASLIISIIPF